MKSNKKYVLLLLLLIITILSMTVVSAENNSNDTTINKEVSIKYDNTQTVLENPNANIKEVNYQKTDTINANTTTQDNITEITSNQKTLKTDTKYPVLYVNSKGLENNTGNDIDNPTTFKHALTNIADNGTIYLVTNSNSDVYTFTTDIQLTAYSSDYSLSRINIIGQNGKNITISGSNKTSLFYIYRVNVNFNNINFINSKGSSGAIYAGSSNITIANSTFTGNYGTKYGSSVYATSSNINITNTLFDKNNCSYGAAIYSTYSTIKITSSNFTRNNASNGAGIYGKNSNITISSSIFANNTAINGAGIYLLKSNTTITSTRFVQNTAKYYGAAIVQLNEGKLNIKTSNFTSNTASTAGAIYVMQSSLTAVTSVFENNNAYMAGAIFTYNNTVVVTDNAIMGNNRNKSLVELIFAKSYNINDNWWGINNPDFASITLGLMPDRWRLMTFKSLSTSGNITQIQVSLKRLSNGATSSVNLPARIVTFKATGATLTKKSASITSEVNNTLNGTGNVSAMIDNQEMLLDSKIIPLLYVSNYTVFAGDNLNIWIYSNKDITGTFTIAINGLTVKSLAAASKVNYSYTISNTTSTGVHTITVTYTGNNIYNNTVSDSKLTIKSKTLDTSNTIIPTRSTTDSIVILPSYYNLKDLNQTTSVKTQGSSGSCVVFAAIGALESSIKKRTNVSYDLSENNMKNLFKMYSILGTSLLDPDDGGYDMEPIGYLASGYGPLFESMDAYDTDSDLSYILDNPIQVQNIYFIPARENYLDNNLIKEAIMKYGGVYTGIRSSSSLNIYNPDVQNSNHAVVIVGWNDTYSRYNFDTTPPGDGAFIIKNSWGTYTGNEGYQYVSYYDSVIGGLQFIGDYSNVNFAIDYRNNYNYTGIYQYDTVDYVYQISETGGQYWIKNIYTAVNNQTIAAIGTYFMDNSTYNISVYINGKLASSKISTVNYPGYRTIGLDKMVLAKENDEITVVVNIKQSLSKSYVYVPLQDDEYPLYDTYNKSFISFDGKNYDELYDYNNNDKHLSAPIKVYTLSTPRINSTLKLTGDVVSVNTTINNLEVAGRLYYLLNGNLLTNSTGGIVSKYIGNNQTVFYSFDVSSLSNGNYTLQTVLVDNGLNISQNKYFSISNHNITIKTTTLTTKINETKNLTVNVTYNNIKVSDGTITLRYSNGTQIASAKVSNGQATLPVMISSSGNFTARLIYSNSKTYPQTETMTLIKVNKLSTKITVSTPTTYAYNNSQITGLLTDSNNKAIINARIYITVNNITKYTTTNSTGGYKYTYYNTIVATNNITVQYLESANYNGCTRTTTYKTIKMPTKTTVNKTKGVIGDKLTLTAKVTDINGNPVKNGYVIFKINGITIKDNGQLNGSNENLKVYVSNGIATTNITAYLNIRSGKNITSVYAGSSTYESSRSNTATAEISLRKAQIVVTTNTTKVKQDQYIKFTATLYDITTGKRITTMTQDSSQYVYFKVNDITLKNKNGTPIQVKIVNGIATYSYKVPLGLSGVTDGKTMTPKNHTVKAGYYNPNYYPDVTNTTKFQVLRSDITINIIQSTINKTSHKINITGTIKDYNKNMVLGTNKIIIKINGLTLKDKNSKPIYYYITNGKINLKNISIPSYNTYTDITIVTQDRLAYKSARTTSKITKITS